jgi:RNA polymerase sigma-70 factor (ECF subfamily)
VVVFAVVTQGSRLSRAFAEAAGGDGAAPTESELEAACTQARAANPGLAVDDETFVAHLGRAAAHGEGPDGARESIAALALEDLYLACACAVRAPGAAAELQRRHGLTVRATIARVVPGPEVAEIEQQLLDEMVVGSPTSPPKIGSYAGRSSLGRWLQVSAQRAALMWIRLGESEGRARRIAAEAGAPVEVHPEVAYLKHRYRDEFQHALEQALQRVTERQRALLRMHLVSGLSMERIGEMFGVTQPTASRWLAQARSDLLDDIKGTLAPRLGVSSDELASLAGLVASGLDMHLSQLLKTR